MKKIVVIVALVLVASFLLAACDPLELDFIVPEDTPKNECAPACQALYDELAEDVYDYFGYEIGPGNSVGACVSQCQTGKFTVLKPNVVRVCSFTSLRTRRPARTISIL